MKLQSASVVARGAPGVCPSFALALNCGDINSAASCFARNGCLITPDATAVQGRDSVRPILAQMVARRTRILVESSNSIRGGEVVLARERWRVRAGELEDRVIEQTLNSTLVLRWIEDSWKLAIVAPWGWGPSNS